jgi:bifunctional non-homologous end joining protein LigD
MRAVVGELPADDGSWAYEVKWDGVRAIGFVGDGRVRLQSSNGHDITPRYPELAALGADLDGHDVVLDGEVVTFNEQGRPDFGLLQNRMHLSDARLVAEWSARQPVVWVVFDLLHLDGHDLYVHPPERPGGGR